MTGCSSQPAIGRWSLVSALVVELSAPALAQCEPVEIARFPTYAATYGDYYGRAIAMSADAIVIGVPWDESPRIDEGGSVHVIERVRGSWVETQRLLAIDVPVPFTQNRQFGWSVAIEGRTILVGARTEPTGGSVYVFEKIGDSWTRTARLTAGDAAPGATFGESVAISGERVLVGAPGDDEHGFQSGAAYVFRRVDGEWVEEAKLEASLPETEATFGTAVALDGETAIVGAPNSWFPKTIGGSASVFEHRDGSWVETARLVDADDGRLDSFGVSVALEGDTALVGGGSEDMGLDSALFFERVGGEWGLVREFSDALDTSNGFGRSVALDGDRALVGAPTAEDDGAINRGVVYAFERSAGDWSQRHRIRGEEPKLPRTFGFSVALVGSLALVSHDNRTSASAAYLIDLLGPPSIRTQPRTQAVPCGTTVLFEVSAESAHPMSYSWRRNGVPLEEGGRIAGTATATLSIEAIEESDEGDYACIVADSCGANTSREARLSVVRSDATFLGRSTGGSSQYGDAVALSGDAMLVGAPGKTESAFRVGRARFYARSGDAWTLVREVAGTREWTTDAFGSAVALRGGEAFVGAPSERVDSTTHRGRVYLYRKVRGDWVDVGHLDGEPDNRGFGQQLAFDGRRLVVVSSDENATHPLTVFERSGDSWAKSATIPDAEYESCDGSGQFGDSLAIDGDTIVAGAKSGGDHCTTGVVYVFEFRAGEWVLADRIVPAGVEPFESFGTSLALRGDTLFVGSSSHGAGIAHSGSVFVFERRDGRFQESGKLVHSEVGAFFSFGLSLAVGETTAVASVLRPRVAGQPTTIGMVFERRRGEWIQSSVLTDGGTSTERPVVTAAAIDGDTVVLAAPKEDDRFTYGAKYVYKLGRRIEVAPPQPGMAGESNTLAAARATPSGDVHFFFGRFDGFTESIVCPGRFFDFRNAKLIGTSRADESGFASVSGFVAAWRRGRSFSFQALDGETCQASEPVEIVFR